MGSRIRVFGFGVHLRLRSQRRGKGRRRRRRAVRALLGGSWDVVTKGLKKVTVLEIPDKPS